MQKIWLAVLLFSYLTAFTPRETTWTAIGDSITYLNDHTDQTGHRITSGYMTRVTAALPGLHYINQGHNGWTAVGIARDIDSLGLTKTDLYSVFLGTNDWWAGLPPGNMDDYRHNTGFTTTCGAFRIIIDKIRGLNAAAKIVLITPMQRGDFVYIADAHNNAFGSDQSKNGRRLAEFADAVKQIGRYEHLAVIDLYYHSGITVKNVVKFKRVKDTATGTYRDMTYPAYKKFPFHPDSDAYPYPPEAVDYTYDGLHPSDKGYQVIADKLVRVFRDDEKAGTEATAK